MNRQEYINLVNKHEITKRKIEILIGLRPRETKRTLAQILCDQCYIELTLKESSIKYIIKPIPLTSNGEDLRLPFDCCKKCYEKDQKKGELSYIRIMEK